mmetsp:Transcript_42821/g.64777  ORF Transcript_42821/g.64777 Transcript_42821/m.64777 type:complete len:241 (-) Transcript_42821:242-964(-)
MVETQQSSSLSKEVHDQLVELVAIFDVDVVLAVGEEMELRVWDVLSEPFWMEIWHDGVLGACENVDGALNLLRFTLADVSSSGHNALHSIAKTIPHGLQIVPVDRGVQGKHALAPILLHVSSGLVAVNVFLQDESIAAEDRHFRDRFGLLRGQDHGCIRSIAPADDVVLLEAQRLHDGMRILGVAVVEVLWPIAHRGSGFTVSPRVERDDLMLLCEAFHLGEEVCFGSTHRTGHAQNRGA